MVWIDRCIYWAPTSLFWWRCRANDIRDRILSDLFLEIQWLEKPYRLWFRSCRWNKFWPQILRWHYRDKGLVQSSPEVVQGNVMDELKIIAFDLLKNLWIIFLKLKLWWWFFILELQWNNFFDLIKFFDWIELLLTNQIYAASDRRVNGLSHRTHKRGFIFEVTVDGFFRHGEFTGDVVHGDALEPKIQE